MDCFEVLYVTAGQGGS